MSKFKLTEEGIAEAAKMKQAGVLDKDIADYLGVCPQTFSMWRNHPKNKLQRELIEELKKAEVRRKRDLLTIIYNKAAKCDTWQAAAWLLERQYPEEFGANRTVQKQEENQVPVFVFEPLQFND